MTLEEARAAIDRFVRYSPAGGPPEVGKITSVNDSYVFVLYDRDTASKATRPEDLTLLGAFILYCTNNGCVCGREPTRDLARRAVQTQGCGYCDGGLKFEWDGRAEVDVSGRV